nr:immunoglobulin heavy chain junction region [Mus musculus]
VLLYKRRDYGSTPLVLR